MIHKISELCDRIQVIHAEAEQLRLMKYGKTQYARVEIDNQIQLIQSMCRLVAQDTSTYTKEK